jgi:hypothetical protein
LIYDNVGKRVAPAVALEIRHEGQARLFEA